MENHINLIVDMGNTRIKTGVFKGQKLEYVNFFDSPDQIKLKEIPEKVIISNVSRFKIDELPDSIIDRNPLVFDRSTKIPVEIVYDSPETLGLDRIAGVVGAFNEFPDSSCLVIDLGSCITYDLINNKGQFLGGVISPGLKMRFRAMNQFTGNLPDLTQSWKDIELLKIGKTTKGCMVKGGIEGILHEIGGFVRNFEEEIGDLNVIMTGGDSSVFESIIKAPIFVRPNLVVAGLNRILNYNEA